ncbi:MAG: hypothetical protein AAF670_03630 [Planctomycetota bacterium]
MSQARMVMNRTTRLGVTLMETIFAIGVIMTGLLGLAALIPVASQNAQATLEMDRSISESTSAAAAGLAQQFNHLDSLVLFDKETAGSTENVVGAYDYDPANRLETVATKIEGTINTVITPVATATLKLETPGYGHHPFDAGLVSALCIDPLGLPDPAYVPLADTSANSFDYSRFPYYGERYAVLSEPNAAVTAGAAPDWPMSPRMWRVTPKSPIYPTTTPISRRQLLPAATARFLFQGAGGLSGVEALNDESSRSVLLRRSNIGGNSVDVTTDSSSDYTWFATLVPPFFGGDSFRQSIIVVRQRQSPVPIRPNDPLALNTAAYTVSDAEENPAAERLCWIDPSTAIGFQGGTGGEVLMYGSQAVSSEINTQEWVMLSRQPHTVSSGALTPDGVAVHRWYRVLRVDEPELESGYAFGGGNYDVWKRWVTLDGPDWAFQDEATPTNSSPVDDTYCTIVAGAVSVIESEVVFE